MHALIPLLLLSCTGAGGPAADTGAGDGSCSSTWWYRDADGDGWGVGDDRVYDCDPGVGWAEPYPDCNDGDATVYPGAPETWYDGVDQDCDGGVNDNDADADGYDWDGQGGDDCNDNDADMNPGAVDVCASGVDENCDGEYAVCGFVEEMTAGEAAVHIQRDPDVNDQGLFGMYLTFAGDSDGDGVPEFIAQQNGYDPEGEDGHQDYNVAHMLIEPAPTGTWDANATTIARFTTNEQAWAVGQFRRSIPGIDLNDDGHLDYFFSTEVDLDDSGKDPRADRDTRIHMFLGPHEAMVNLDESALVLHAPADPDGAVISNGALGLLEPPIDGDDWVLAASHWISNPTGESWTAAHLVTIDNFEGRSDWTDSPAVWTTGGTDYDVRRMEEVGDLDGDGLADLAFSSEPVTVDNYVPPRVWALRGPDLEDRSLSDADITIDADSGNHGDLRFKLLPDWERSGYPVVAARLDTDDGAGWFFYELPPSGALHADDAFASIQATDDFAIDGDLVYGGDLDADGEPELALAAFPDVDGTDPFAVVTMPLPSAGVTSASDYDVIIRQDDAPPGEDAAGTELGQAMLGNIDFNADGFPDLLISEPYWDDDTEGSWEYGRISLFHGGPVGF